MTRTEQIARANAAVEAAELDHYRDPCDRTVMALLAAIERKRAIVKGVSRG